MQTKMTYALKVTFPTDDMQRAALQNVPLCAEPSEQCPIPPDHAVQARSLGSPSAKSARGPQSWRVATQSLVGNTFSNKERVS